MSFQHFFTSLLFNPIHITDTVLRDVAIEKWIYIYRNKSVYFASVRSMEAQVRAAHAQRLAFMSR